MSGAVAPKPVGHQSVRLTTLPFQEPAKEAFGRAPIPPWLNEKVECVAVLVDGAPQILPLTLDGDEELIEVLVITEASLTALESAGVLATELPAPLSNRFVRDRDAALGQEIFDVAEAQAEAVVEPDGMADDHWRRSVAAVTERCGVREASLPVSGST